LSEHVDVKGLSFCSLYKHKRFAKYEVISFVLNVGACKEMIAQVRGQLKVKAVAIYTQLQKLVTDFGTSSASQS
jgi:hypothetical protein